MYKIKLQTSYNFVDTLYAMMQWDGMQCISSLLPWNPTCIIIPVLTAPTSGYGIFLCIPKEGAIKMQYCNTWTSYTSKFNIKRNTTIDDKVYSKISKMNFIYQIIWLMWILKLNGGDSNNKWNLVDHGATFICRF
jgi:hypothetical protein